MLKMYKRGRGGRSRCAIALLCALLLWAGGCGRKAPPRPPEADPLPVATNLKAQRQGDQVLLTWALAPLSGRLAKDARFAVYRDDQPVDAPACPGCPPRYVLVAQLPYNPNAPLGEMGLGFQFSDPVAAGHRYRYQIALRLNDGRQGEPTQSVEVTID